MKPLAEFSADAGRRLTGVFTDIDDTLTSDGQLPAKSYSAMERLRDSGLAVVPITGRPAGWCDLGCPPCGLLMVLSERMALSIFTMIEAIAKCGATMPMMRRRASTIQNG
jgi:hypothetical protein